MIAVPARQHGPRTMAKAMVFGQGCDARLAGCPLWVCPYPEPSELRKYWHWGWHDVNDFWAVAVDGWPVRKLPAVRK